MAVVVLVAVAVAVPVEVGAKVGVIGVRVIVCDGGATIVSVQVGV